MEGLVIPYHGHMIRIAASVRGRWKLLAADKVPWEEQGRPYFQFGMEHVKLMIRNHGQTQAVEHSVKK